MGISAEFEGTGRECAGRLWQGTVWLFYGGTVYDVGVFPALAGGGSLLSALGLSLSMW